MNTYTRFFQIRILVYDQVYFNGSVYVDVVFRRTGLQISTPCTDVDILFSCKSLYCYDQKSTLNYSQRKTLVNN